MAEATMEGDIALLEAEYEKMRKQEQDAIAKINAGELKPEEIKKLDAS